MANGLMLDPGELDQRVTFRQKQETSDGAGGVTIEWVDYATRWAQVKPMSGERRFQAEQADFTRDTEVTIRRDPDIDETMAIVWQGRSLEIQFIADFGPRSAYTRIECRSGGVQDALP
jgi:SPP1 family predicted phage head-tail adaptor